MNSSSLFRFGEWTALILLTLVALGIAAAPRRILARQARAAKGKAAKALLSALECLIFPLLAMGLGWAALWAPEALGVSWADGCPPSHRSAWHLFWLAMLVFNFAESLLLQILSWGGKAPIPALLRGVLRVVVTALAVGLLPRRQRRFDCPHFWRVSIGLLRGGAGDDLCHTSRSRLGLGVQLAL